MNKDKEKVFVDNAAAALRDYHVNPRLGRVKKTCKEAGC